MIWVLLTVVAVLLVGVFAGMLAGRIGYDPLADPVRSQPDVGLSDGFTARSISEVHFDTALRGYRMDQVDRVLDTLQDRIAEQERELASLRPAVAVPPAVQRPEPELVQEPEPEPVRESEPTSERDGGR
ncbi:DivIVA domain-containing protein [Knoellia sp. 3-2P3]|uniref:DivIVA domain-containing protein n=1 Tax=unclassified Knoellia TaxID=2618719 RepID=UPI0023DC8528|nr:DivIVA domain-containing protein [Knoellia sp. 3-2P3]MDF2093394.1 DivIVA domain-containing protein [Knoellia sp. 3-2P3]